MGPMSHLANARFQVLWMQMRSARKKSKSLELRDGGRELKLMMVMDSRDNPSSGTEKIWVQIVNDSGMGLIT